MLETLKKLVETETVIGPGIYVLIAWGVLVIAALVMLFRRKSIAKYTAAYVDEYPDAVRILITEYLNPDEAILIKSVNGKRPAFFKKHGKIDGFYAKVGPVFFVAKHELYGTMGSGGKPEKVTPWVELDFEVEEGGKYSVRYDIETESFAFWEIEAEE